MHFNHKQITHQFITLFITHINYDVALCIVVVTGQQGKMETDYDGRVSEHTVHRS